MWRRYLAVRKFRNLMNAATWNLLDNNQEQLNLKRAERIRSAEHTLALLAKQQVGRYNNLFDMRERIIF